MRSGWKTLGGFVEVGKKKHGNCQDAAIDVFLSEIVIVRLRFGPP